MLSQNKQFASVRNLACTFTLLAAILSYASPGTAQALATFTATGTMTTPRVGHTATLLPNGKVLMAGGSGSDFRGLASAELYDPSTKTFAAIGNMTMARSHHSATLLADGTVLIAGGGCFGNDGCVPGALLATAELYDRSNGTFTAVGNMIEAQAWHTATLLGNGRS